MHNQNNIKIRKLAYMDIFIKSLKIKCKIYGCLWKGTLRELDEHLNNVHVKNNDINYQTQDIFDVNVDQNNNKGRKKTR